MTGTALGAGGSPLRLSGIFDARRVRTAFRAMGPALFYGVRLWLSVCLALYVAYWLQIDNAAWAGTTAAIVSQPQLGASLRKGWFRIIGTTVGAVFIVVLTACFPQHRVLFLGGLALWAGVCGFGSTILRNFAAYAAALSGYTAVIIASDLLGPTGGTSPDVFLLAVARVTAIAIGIVSAGVVLATTDLGRARQELARLFAALTTGIAANFTRTLEIAGPDFPDTQPIRRDFLRRVIVLDPVIDRAIGESSQIRYHSPTLQRAVDGLFTALSGWRGIANHLARRRDNQAHAEAASVLQCLPLKLLPLLEDADPARWATEPAELQRCCAEGARGLLVLQANTPSQRLLADQAAEALVGISDALGGLALLVRDPTRQIVRQPGKFRLRVPDLLPALVNAVRAFITLSAVSLFWIVTEWPNGATAITWTAIPVILYGAHADQAYHSAKEFATGTLLAAVFAAIINFAVLPGVETFPAFSLALGIYFIPIGALATQSRHTAMFAAMASYLMPLLAPANQMSFDPGQYYNSATGVLAGAWVAAVSFRLLPPLPPTFLTRRLQRLTLRDLRRLARGRTFHDWESHIYGRLSALPAEATPLQRAEVLAALSLGTEIMRLRPIVRRLGLDTELNAALAAIAQGKSSSAIAHLALLDAALCASAAAARVLQVVLRARGSLLTISELMTQHAAYLDGRA